jgi:hypothetical protein
MFDLSLCWYNKQNAIVVFNSAVVICMRPKKVRNLFIRLHEYYLEHMVSFSLEQYPTTKVHITQGQHMNRP